MASSRAPAYVPVCVICQRPVTLHTSRPLAVRRIWREDTARWDAAQLRVCKTAEACGDPAKWRVMTQRFRKGGKPVAGVKAALVNRALTAGDIDTLVQILEAFQATKVKLGKCPVCGADVAMKCAPTCIQRQVDRLRNKLTPMPTAK